MVWWALEEHIQSKLTALLSLQGDAAFFKGIEIQMESQGIRIFPEDSISFQYTAAPHGALSNFSDRAVLNLDGIPRALPGENIFQALRVTDEALQREILLAPTAKASKKIAHTYIKQTRPDWMELTRYAAMRIVIGYKALQNASVRDELRNAIANRRPLVEVSSHDQEWAAIRGQDGRYYGRNLLGRLLMEQAVAMFCNNMELPHPCNPTGLKLMGKDILDFFPEPGVSKAHAESEERQLRLC